MIRRSDNWLLGPYHSRGVKGDDGCLQNLRGTRECERIQKRGAGQWCFKHDESSLIVGVHKHAMLGGGRLSYLVMEGVSKFTTHLAGCLLIISAARGDSASSVSAADDHANSRHEQYRELFEAEHDAFGLDELDAMPV